MELLSRLRVRKSPQHELDSQILEVAGMAIVTAMDKREEGERLPFQVEIPPEPRGISTKNYLERVQYGVTLVLEERDHGDLECDEYMSGLVNARAITGRANTNVFTRHYNSNNPRLVFREPQPARETSLH